MRNVGYIYVFTYNSIIGTIVWDIYVDNKLYIICNPYKSGSALRVQSLILLRCDISKYKDVNKY
jgi:hypothetical protein